MKLSFEDYLKKENLSQHTISVYLWTVDYFISNYKDFNTENLHAYKGYLMEFFKPKTVNLDLYSKGGKLRRLYIPKKLREETQKWLLEEQRTTGYLFLNRFGERITARGISQQLKNYADKYGLDSKVIYPHSFRHLYAKNFLEKYNDIALLADLMGHESIETTRIYLRRTATEQQSLIDKIVTW